MSDKSDFQANSCFWYYGVLTIILIILGWACVLIGFPDREPIPGKKKSDLRWPANLHNWEYSIHSVIPYIIWSISLVLFGWGAYHADCRDIPDQVIQIYRSFFLGIIVLDVLALFLFFILHNVIAALAAHIYSLVLIMGLIMLYSEIDVNDAWFAYPYFLWIIYFIYTTWFALNMNKNHAQMRNILFAL